MKNKKQKLLLPLVNNDTKLGSNFVACPLNCGKHIAIRQMNPHLDVCLANSAASDQEQPTHVSTTQRSQSIIPKRPLLGNDDDCGKQDDQKRNIPKTNTIHDDSPSTTSSVFDHMMKCSKSSAPMKQRFHLHSIKGELSWSTIIPHHDSNKSDKKFVNEISWYGSTILKKASNQANGLSLTRIREIQTAVLPLPHYRDLELTISSSVPPSTNGSECQKTNTQSRKHSLLSDNHQPKLEANRLVQKHSALSVPVLKSMIQKLIRRRRPLPAVRVAMELADKSWSDLIRRIPIIILEDSTLHPDMPLLVWLMVADSKGFIPPRTLVIKVMQIIFEIASCPWKDFLPTPKTLKNNDDNSLPLCLNLDSTILDEEFHQFHCHYADMNIRAMLLRKQYGGMQCDVQMLTDFVQLWKERYRCTEPISRKDINCHDTLNDKCRWVDLPSRIYQNLREKSQTYIVEGLFKDEEVVLDRLVMSDLCLAGIDFHCTNIMDIVLNQTDKDVFQHISLHFNNNESDVEIHDQTKVLKQFLKSCMWKYHSGVNLRRPLNPNTTGKKETVEKDQQAIKKADIQQQIWKQFFVQSVNQYAEEYLKKRLVMS